MEVVFSPLDLIGVGWGLARAGVRAVGKQAARGADDAASVVGRRGAPLQNAPYQPVRNAPTSISGRDYTGHAPVSVMTFTLFTGSKNREVRVITVY
jgi:hypothetical protein